MKLSLLSKIFLIGAIGVSLSPLALADSKRDHDRHDNHDRGDHRHDYRRGNYSYGRSYHRVYGRPYYGYGYGYPYYYSYPRTTIAIGLGTGYDTEYVGSYRSDDDRPIYRGQQISEKGSASLELSVQKKLSRLGYYNGTIDGDIGPATRRAISKYQRDNDLAETGRIDRSLVNSLGVS